MLLLQLLLLTVLLFARLVAKHAAKQVEISIFLQWERVLGDRIYAPPLILATASELSSLPHCAPSLSPTRRPGSSPSSLLYH